MVKLWHFPSGKKHFLLCSCSPRQLGRSPFCKLGTLLPRFRRLATFADVDRSIHVLVFSRAGELGTNASPEPTKSLPMTARDSWQMFNTKVRKTCRRGRSRRLHNTVCDERQQQNRQKTHCRVQMFKTSLWQRKLDLISSANE